MTVALVALPGTGIERERTGVELHEEIRQALPRAQLILRAILLVAIVLVISRAHRDPARRVRRASLPDATRGYPVQTTYE